MKNDYEMIEHAIRRTWNEKVSNRLMKIVSRGNMEQEDFGTLCICALRYCHGRKTYMPSMVQRIVRNHFNDLSDKDLRVILEDEEFQNHMELWGDDCDKFDWQRFYGDLRAYMEEE